MAYRGKFKPKNPSKYIGNNLNIVYRSSWECKFMSWLDRQPSIVSWASEEVVVPYISPLDGKKHRYFPDFLIKMVKKDGSHEIELIEIKPDAQTRPPRPKKSRKRFLRETTTYMVNQAKWDAAKKFSETRGWTFRILTEKHLNY